MELSAADCVTAVAVPVKAGDAKGAFKSKAVCVAVDIGLPASVVLLTLANPTIVAVIPATVPVNVGLAFGAYVDAANVVVRYGDKAVDIVVARSDIFELVIVDAVVRQLPVG